MWLWCGVWENGPEEVMLGMRPECLEGSSHGESRKCPVTVQRLEGPSGRRVPRSISLMEGESERESCRRNTLWKCRLQIPLEALIHSQQLPGYFDYEIINHFIVFSLGGGSS